MTSYSLNIITSSFFYLIYVGTLEQVMPHQIYIRSTENNIIINNMHIIIIFTRSDRRAASVIYSLQGLTWKKQIV